VVAFLGHRTGEHAPGLQDEKLALQVAHHLLVAHGLGAQALRASEAQAQVGIVLDLWPIEPASDGPEEVAAAERAWQQSSAWFLDPIFRAHYPVIGWQAYGANVPQILPADWALIAQRLDFLGVNYYSRTLLRNNSLVARVPDAEYTDMGWEVHAPALQRLLARIQREYRLPPIYLTENGAAFPDPFDSAGRVHDPRRVNYLREHLIQMRLAMDQGVDVRGYFVWSLLDNFEWAYGYAKRFGLIYVDYPTQQRIFKDSAAWYAQVIAQNQVEQVEMKR